MTGSLLPELFLRAIDASGVAMSGAKLYFFLTTTTTPTSTYTSSTLGTPNANPVVADSGGLFPAIFLDPATIYRIQLKTSAGVLVDDLDPFTTGASITANSITAAMLQAGVAVSNLGYTPLSNGGGFLSGEVAINYTMSTPPDPKSIGFRGMPAVTKNTNYTFTFDDSGKLYRHTDGSAYAWTIPPHSSVGFAQGTVLPFRNYGSGIITLTRGAGVAQTIAGSGTSKDIAVAQYGAGSLINEDIDVWYVVGTGLT